MSGGETKHCEKGRLKRTLVIAAIALQLSFALTTSNASRYSKRETEDRDMAARVQDQLGDFCMLAISSHQHESPSSICRH